jgi:large subunit ribosomal protein L18
MERKEKVKRREKRKKRTRAKTFGTKERPRLCVFRSLKHIYAQIVDDTEGKTLVSASDLELKNKKGMKKVEIAKGSWKIDRKKGFRKENRESFF